MKKIMLIGCLIALLMPSIGVGADRDGVYQAVQRMCGSGGGSEACIDNAMSLFDTGANLYEYIALGCKQTVYDYRAICYSKACTEFSLVFNDPAIKKWLGGVKNYCTTQKEKDEYKCFRDYFLGGFVHEKLKKSASLLKPAQTLICQR